MPAFTAQYQFAASFTVFLVALAGLALVILRESLTTRPGARLALGAGFIGIGTGAFLQGSLLIADGDDPALLALRVAGAVALLVGSIAWRGRSVSHSLLVTGAVGLLLAVPLEAAGRSNAAATIAALGGLLVGAALIAASRVAIAARVAASAAATLLLVVLVLSVALSAVLGRTVEDQALADLDDRAVTEAGAIEAESRSVLDQATVVATLLADLRENRDDATSAPVLSSIDRTKGPNPAQRAALQGALDRVREDLFTGLGFVLVDPDQRVVASSGDDPEALADAAAAPVVREALTSTGRVATPILRSGAVIVGVRPLVLEQGGGPVGAVVGVRPLDDRYLEVRVADGAADSLALVASGGTVVARSGPLPPVGVLGDLAGEVLGARSRSRAVTEDRYAAARSVRSAGGAGGPVLAVISSRSTAQVEDVREDLFRTFFVIAFGGTVLALLLAAVVGDRIGAGIRRLTSSAEAIQRGELGVRSGIRSEDEVGVLGATFDSMAASIEEQTDALQEAAERVEAIVAGMGEALVAVDRQGCVTDFNAAAEELLGVAASSARGTPIDVLLTLTAEDGGDLTSRLRSPEPGRWSALGDVRPGRAGAEGADAAGAGAGVPVPVAVTAGALRAPDGDVVGGVIVLRDLRGEREVERMKRHFLSRVGHELRTPLTPLIGYSQLLAGRELPPERARPVYDSILSSAKRLERIVEMLEFFASLDAGRQVLRSEPVDLRGVLAAVVERRAAALDGSRHQLSKRVARDTPRVLVDGRWLERSIDELVDNAVKFSPKGGRVQVTAGRLADDPSVVEIAVRDAGVGMSPDEVAAAFTEWAQGDESDTRHFGGLGLGLALVQRVAEHHGGRVVCATAPGKGARFAILLPALEEAAPITRRRGSRAVTSGRDRPGRDPGR